MWSLSAANLRSEMRSLCFWEFRVMLGFWLLRLNLRTLRVSAWRERTWVSGESSLG